MSTQNVKSFIDELTAINESNVVSVKVPSLEKKVKFKLLSVAQQKDMLRTAFEGIEGTVRNNAILNDIIINNCMQDVEFSLLDRSPILLELRKHSIGSSVTIDDKKYDLDDLPEPTLDGLQSTGCVEYSGIKVHVNIPTLREDRDISEKIVSEISKLNDKVKRKDSVSILLAYEIIKFITKIEVNDNVLDFSDTPIYERKKIVDNLPLKINNSIIKFIAEYKDIEERNTTFSDGAKLEIDASFMTTE